MKMFKVWMDTLGHAISTIKWKDEWWIKFEEMGLAIFYCTLK